MNISAINNKNIAFSGVAASVGATGGENPIDYVKEYAQVKKDFDLAMKSKAKKEVFDEIYERLSKIETVSKNAIRDKKIPKVFYSIMKYFGKIKIERTGNKAIDTASKLTKLVLWGNVGKEAIGTAVYTAQALTNEDLPKDKRKFVGMYDLAVGLVSTAFSFIFGVGLENKIKTGYKNLLKPLSESKNAAIKSKAAAAIVGLAAFSSFALQTIVGKRIIAPAIATPAAGKLKTKLEERELETKAKEASGKANSNKDTFTAESKNN